MSLEGITKQIIAQLKAAGIKAATDISIVSMSDDSGAFALKCSKLDVDKGISEPRAAARPPPDAKLDLFDSNLMGSICQSQFASLLQSKGANNACACVCGCADPGSFLFGTRATSADAAAAIEKYRSSADMSRLAELADTSVNADELADSMPWPRVRQMNRMVPSIIFLWAHVAVHSERAEVRRLFSEELHQCVLMFPYRGWAGSLRAALASTPVNSRGVKYARNGMPCKPHELHAATKIAKETGELDELMACADVRVVTYMEYFAIQFMEMTNTAKIMAAPELANLAYVARHTSQPDFRTHLTGRLIEYLRMCK